MSSLKFQNLDKKKHGLRKLSWFRIMLFISIYIFFAHLQLLSVIEGYINKALFISQYQSQIAAYIKDIIVNESTKLIYIPTALYFPTDSKKSLGEQRRRCRYDAKKKLSFIANSLNIDNADLLELDQSNLNELKLKEILGVGNKKQIFVYVDGGNTFYLQKFILQSNLFNHLECEDTEYIYLGCSAGAIVAGKSIETAFWKGWDDPSVVGESFEWNATTLKGASIVDFSMFMHYDALLHETLVANKAPALKHGLQTIANNEIVDVIIDKDNNRIIKKIKLELTEE